MMGFLASQSQRTLQIVKWEAKVTHFICVMVLHSARDARKLQRGRVGEFGLIKHAQGPR